jgi:hypothetical protein
VVSQVSEIGDPGRAAGSHRVPTESGATAERSIRFQLMFIAR